MIYSISESNRYIGRLDEVNDTLISPIHHGDGVIHIGKIAKLLPNWDKFIAKGKEITELKIKDINF
jgi:hypothetical protein